MRPPRWVAPVLAVAVAATAIILSGREVKSPDGNDLIRTPAAYQEANSKVRAATLDVFVAADRGEEITPAMKARLQEAIPYLKEMNRYAPVKVGAYFALGKAQMLLGNLEEAGRGLEQAILNETADQEERNTPALKATVIEAKCLLAEVLLDLAVRRLADAPGMPTADAERARIEARRFQERALTWANQAVEVVPQAPRYVAAQAAALLALGREAEGKRAIERAIALDPNHFKVRPLATLLKGGGQ